MIRITVLSENTSREGFESEHGLSLFIKTDKHSILFDMGQGELFLRNADRLGIDLRDVDVAVLSHGHYDHGGVTDFLPAAIIPDFRKRIEDIRQGGNT